MTSQRRRSRSALWLCTLLVSGGWERAAAADGTWISGGDGVFGHSNNWLGGVVPGPSDGANFNIGGAFHFVDFNSNPVNSAVAIGNDNVGFDLSGHVYSVDDCYVGLSAGQNARLEVDNGTLDARNVTIGNFAGSTGTMFVDFPAVLDVFINVHVGTSGAGTLFVSGDVHSLNAFFGSGPTGVGVGTLDGAIWNTDNTFAVGGTNTNQRGTGTVTIDSSQLNCNEVHLWDTGHLNVSTSTVITTNGDFIIENGAGFNFAGGTINMTGPGASFRSIPGNFSFGQLNPGSFVPTLKLTGGGNATFTTSWSIASGLNTHARMIIDGAGSSLAGTGANSDLIVGDFNGNGTLSVTNGGTASVSDDLLVGSGSSGDGTLLISGDDSTSVRTNGAASQIVIGSSGHGTLSVSGGARLETTGDFVVASTATATGIGTITSNIIGDESNLVIGGGLYVGGTSAAAGGAGTLVIVQNAKLDVTGPTKVYAGDVLLMNGGANPGVLNTTRIDVVGGALSIGSSTPANFNITTGTINISGGGSFTSQQYDAVADSITITDPGSSWTQTNRIAVQSASTLRVLNGALVTSPGMNVGDTGAGTVVVDGSGSHVNVTGIGALSVGGGTGDGTLVISNGGKVTKTGGVTVIGLNNTTTGRVTVTGLNSLLDTAGISIGAGAAGDSTLNVLEGARVNSTVGQISTLFNSQAQPVVTVASSTGNESLWSISDSLYVGGGATGAAGFAALNANAGGRVDVANLLRIYGTGSVNITGGAIDPHTLEMQPGSRLTVDATGDLVVSTNSTGTVDGIYVGRGSTGAVGTMMVNGGTVSCASTTSIGETGASAGTVILSNSANWSSAGSIRVARVGAATLQVLSGSDISTPGTFTIGATSNGTGTVLLDGAGSTLNAATLDLASTATNTARLTIANGGLMAISGPAHVGRLGPASITLNGSTSQWTNTGPVYLGGTSTAAGGAATLSLNGGTVSAGLVKLWNNGRINYSGGRLSVSTLELAGGGDIVLAAGSGAHLRANAISIDTANPSVVDLNDNTMQVTGGMTYAQVSSLIASGRHGGLWDGPGITSTAAKNASPQNTTLGALTGAEYKSVYGAAALFEGFGVGNSDVLVKYTYYGDTDFNGKVDGADYAHIDTSFNNQVAQGNIAGWFNGDLDYNGKVDGTDYALIDAAFNSQGLVLRGGGNFVPEPVAGAMLAAAIGLKHTSRRRRSRRS